MHRAQYLRLIHIQPFNIISVSGAKNIEITKFQISIPQSLRPPLPKKSRAIKSKFSSPSFYDPDM